MCFCVILSYMYMNDKIGEVNAAKPELAHILKNRIIQKKNESVNVSASASSNTSHNRDYSFGQVDD